MAKLSYQFNTTKVQPTGYVSEYPLNNHTHEIELYIVNETGIYAIAPTAIVSLTIENSLSNWVVSGDLTVMYSNELGENLNGGFNFRNDGEDLLRIRIVPIDAAIGKQPSLNIKKDIWELNFMFSIYNIEDVTSPGGGNSLSEVLKKFRRFSFWDVRYQRMITQNIEYSTATSDLLSTPSVDNSDDSRSLSTELAMYDIIKTSLNEDTLLSKTGFEQDPELGWDKGATKIFYTSSANNNAYEDLMYIFERHTSTISSNGVNDFCILYMERGNGDLGYFTLRPISQYFKKSTDGDQPGELQLEHFFLQADTQSTPGLGLYRAPITNISNPTRDIKIKDYNTILKYEFVDIAPLMNAKAFAATPVYSFDFYKRQYNVEFQDNSLATAKNFINQKYIKPLYKRKNANEGVFLLNNDTTYKEKKLTINPVYSLYGNSTDKALRFPDGIHNLLRTGLFQNTCINFTVQGLTMREPGTFIAIDRPQGSKDFTVDDKLCGQWFVINVIHTISNGAYYNNITAVKMHRYQPPLLTDQQTNQIFSSYVQEKFGATFAQ